VIAALLAATIGAMSVSPLLEWRWARCRVVTISHGTVISEGGTPGPGDGCTLTRGRVVTPAPVVVDVPAAVDLAEGYIAEVRDLLDRIGPTVDAYSGGRTIAATTIGNTYPGQFTARSLHPGVRAIQLVQAEQADDPPNVACAAMTYDRDANTIAATVTAAACPAAYPGDPDPETAAGGAGDGAQH
jgi:hypothetical protein